MDIFRLCLVPVVAPSVQYHVNVSCMKTTSQPLQMLSFWYLIYSCGLYKISECFLRELKDRKVLRYTFSSELCTLVILKINVCRLTLAILWFILLYQPLFLPCLFKKVYWEGRCQAASVYFHNRQSACFLLNILLEFAPISKLENLVHCNWKAVLCIKLCLTEPGLIKNSRKEFIFKSEMSKFSELLFIKDLCKWKISC